MTSTSLQIRIDDLSGAATQALLAEHLRNMQQNSPPQSVHALDLDGLRQPEISFWSVWSAGGELMGCGALKALGAGEGELKSMRTAEAHRRRGVASAMLAHIVAEARARGYARLYLETGPQPAFAAARRLYEQMGFVYCGPFAGYAEDPYSVFMTLRL